MKTRGLRAREIAVGNPRDFVRGPVLIKESVVVASRRAGARGDGRTTCLRRSDLEILWDVSSEGLWWVEGQGGRLVCSGGLKGDGVRSPEDGRMLWRSVEIYGIRAWKQFAVAIARTGLWIELRNFETGTTVRRIPVGDEPLEHGSGVIVGDRFFVGSATIRCFNLESGVLEWQRDVWREIDAHAGMEGDPGFLAPVPGTLGDRLISFYRNATVAWSAVDGSVLWVRPGCRGTSSRPSAIDGRIYGSFERDLWIIEERTGELILRRKYPEFDGHLCYHEKQAKAFQRRLALPFETGGLAIFNMENGDLVDLYKSKYPLWQCEEADGRLLVATGNGRLLAFDQSIWGL